MRRNLLLPLAACLCMIALPAKAQEAPSAEVKIGLGVEKSELTGGSETFTVAAGTKIYAWTKVTGAAETKITIAFQKDGKEVSKVELSVPRSPYRTNAYRTFRAGDSGAWTASVLSAEGQELGKAAFTVTVE
jgi:hypothetical protein